PDLWLTANDKFPRGLAFLPAYIKSKGLKPGIWTNVAFKQADYAAAHKDWFVTDENGEPARGNWVEFSLDGSNPEALDAVVRPVYRGLKDMGWEYFKVDALRHLRYEGYNAHAGYFHKRKKDPVKAFRAYVEAVREEIGRDRFILGCWGIRPELAGLIDGCRIGTDGFSYAGMAQFNSWNNVVWRNDPDHIELNEDRFKSTLVTSLTGSVLLLTDKPEVYRTDVIEPARRAAPVLWTVPGQIFDVDPSRSDELGRVAAEVSGSGSRVFDASLLPTCDLFLLEIDRPFESWAVLGRTGESVREIKFGDLGLDPSKEYYVFEFWTKRLLGSFSGSFAPGPLDPLFRSQALAIRERTSHPQVLATSRHVTCGGVDLADVRWSGLTLTGTSRVVAGDAYEVYLTEPEGTRLRRFEGPAGAAVTVEREGALVKVRWLPAASGTNGWVAEF
ncbi:MAG: alpha-galactosidase, partial [Candidatus Aminicenantales bacterium]